MMMITTYMLCHQQLAVLLFLLFWIPPLILFQRNLFIACCHLLDLPYIPSSPHSPHHPSLCHRLVSAQCDLSPKWDHTQIQHRVNTNHPTPDGSDHHVLIIYLRKNNFCEVCNRAIGRAEYSFVVSEAAEPKAVKTWPVAASPSPTLVTLNSFHADFSSHLSTAEELDSPMSRLNLCSSHTCVTGLRRAPWCFKNTVFTSLQSQVRQRCRLFLKREKTKLIC